MVENLCVVFVTIFLLSLYRSLWILTWRLLVNFPILSFIMLIWAYGFVENGIQLPCGLSNHMVACGSKIELCVDGAELIYKVPVS